MAAAAAEAVLRAVTTNLSVNAYAGKSALITGGSSGIGLALAKQLAGAGAHVAILARDPAKLERACQEIRAARRSDDQRVEALSVDVASHASVMQTLAAYPAPDYLFNSAGVAHPGLFQDLEIEIFRWMMDVNYFGTLHVIQALLPGMLARGSGHIINFSSIAGFQGIYGYSAYSPSKFAVRGLSDVLRAELKPHHIRLSVVFPPDTQTPQLEYENQFKPEVLKILDRMNKVMRPEEVARIVLRDAARGVYLITPGFDSTLFFHLHNLLGPLSYRVMDLMLWDAHRKAQAAAKNQGSK